MEGQRFRCWLTRFLSEAAWPEVRWPNRDLPAVADRMYRPAACGGRAQQPRDATGHEWVEWEAQAEQELLPSGEIRRVEKGYR